MTVNMEQDAIGAERQPLPNDLSLLSIVVPVYGSPESLEPLHARLGAVCRDLGAHHELILVDDRCPKGSWQKIRGLAKKDPKVVGVRLSRNFGQHAAIQAGLAHSRGDWVVVMDCDLQDRPEEIPQLLARAAEGYDVVRGERLARNDSWLRRAFSRGFYAVLSYLTDTPQSPGVANFGVYRRKVIDAVLEWQEESKYFPAIIPWVGFNHDTIGVRHDRRGSGKSSYSFKKLLRLASDVIVGFSDKPLRLIVKTGILFAGLAFLTAAYIFMAKLTGQIEVEGWTAIMVSLWFLGGLMLAALGINGLYVGRILAESKGRPTFVVDELLSQEVRTIAGRVPRSA